MKGETLLAIIILGMLGLALFNYNHSQSMLEAVRIETTGFAQKTIEYLEQNPERILATIQSSSTNPLVFQGKHRPYYGIVSANKVGIGNKIIVTIFTDPAGSKNGIRPVMSYPLANSFE